MALCDVVEQDNAWAYLVALWSWASEFCPSGVIKTRGVPRLVERETGWTGEHGRLFDAMIATGWLLANGDEITISGWEEYQLPHIEHAKREAARQKRLREERKAKVLLASYETEDRTLESTEDRTRTLARPDRDIDKREEKRDLDLDLTLANFAGAKVAGGEGELFSGLPTPVPPEPKKRGRPPKTDTAEQPQSVADRDAWLAKARALIGLTEAETPCAKGFFVRFAAVRKQRGIEQMLRALEGLEGDTWASQLGLASLLSDAVIEKGLARKSKGSVSRLDLSQMDYSTWDEI